MNNLDFIAKAIDIACNYKTLYVMGCFGSPLTASNKIRYCQNHSYNKDPERTAMIQNASADTFGFDCVCLVKGILWGWDGDTSKTYGGATYASNGVPDVGADTMINYCEDISSDFSNILPGEFVWMSGHCGIYIGEGEVVESTPAWKNCVQITKLSARKWLKHGKLPWVEYERVTDNGNLPSSWAVDSWNWAIDKGITDGTNPQGVCTREQVVAMIRRALNEQ